MKTNYHTHNYRCKHAVGSIEDYIEEAIREGYDEIGISDHLPHPNKDIDNQSRMTYEDLSTYFKEIDEAREKYKDKIVIKKAIEAEYFEDYAWLYKELKEEYKVDYLILGVHFFPYEGTFQYIGRRVATPELLETYVDYVIKSMESGLFEYMAHPDLFGMSYREWDEHAIKQSRRILETAERLDIAIEINVNGLKKEKLKYNLGERCPYPIKDFWELSKEYNVRVIIGVDAHAPQDLKGLYIGEEFAKEHNLNVIDRL